MEELIRELQKFGDLKSGGDITLVSIVLVLVLSFVLSMALAWIYRFTHRGVSYSQQYAHSLVILGVVVALIMLIIGSNIARAFALVGALSIIRFRNAMKEPRDVAFVFMVMGVGMAVGTRLFPIAAFATVFLSAFVVAMYKFNLFAKEVRERILRIQLPVDQDHEKAFEEPFRKYLEEQRLIALETVRAGILQEVVYSIVIKRGTSPRELLEAIRAANGNNKVTLILGQQEIDI